MKKYVVNFEHTLIMILFPLMCFLILMMTISRITGIYPEKFLWAEEAARYLMIWMSFLAAIQAAKSKSHFRMTALVAGIKSPAVRKILGCLATLVSLGIMLIILYYGYNLIARQMRSGQTSPVLLFPMWAAYLAIPVGFFGMFIWTVVNAVRDARADEQPKPEEEPEAKEAP